MANSVVISALTLLLLTLTGCGQMGPLYLPDQEPAPATTPASPQAEDEES